MKIIKANRKNLSRALNVAGMYCAEKSMYIFPHECKEEVYKIAQNLRENSVRVAVDISGKKLPDQLKSLDKRKIPFVMTVGEEEIKNQTFTVRNTKTREEKNGNLEEVIKLCVR